MSPERVELYAKYNRVVVARNPYVRFLSGYQDWM